MFKLLSIYGDLVIKRPLTTQVITAGIITTAADVTAQYLENKPTGYDLRRTAVMSTFGFFYYGPIIGTWFRFLKYLNMRVVPSIALDQSVFGPCMCAGFVFLHPIISQQGVTKAKEIFRNSYFKVLKTNWCVWLPAQIINFSLVPFRFRLLYVQTIALGWIAFLSYYVNSKETQNETPIEISKESSD